MNTLDVKHGPEMNDPSARSLAAEADGGASDPTWEGLSSTDERSGVTLQPGSLASLLGQVTRETFFADYWGLRPLRVRGENPDVFRHLMSLERIERQLSSAEFFRRQAIAAPRREYGAPEAPPTSLGDLYQRMQQGSSIRLRQMECWLDPSEPLVRLARALELELQHPLDSISCYVTPGSAVGLGAHHDETEIFTLQVSGRKRWRLYHREPSGHARLHDARRLGSPAQDFSLEPGDLLYLPAGWIHDVTNDAPSLSLTLVFNPIRWSALLELLLSSLQHTPAFLETLPAGELLSETPSRALSSGLQRRMQLIREAMDGITARDLATEGGRALIEKMTLPPSSGRSALLELEELTLDTRLQKRGGMAHRVVRSDDRVTLLLPGGYTVQMSAKAEPALTAIVERVGPFRMCELHHGLSDAAKLALAKELVRSGFLCLA